jgi:hypothetical protein
MTKLNRQELVELVRRIIESDFETEEESWKAVELLQANVPDPNVTDYIFWPDPIDRDVNPAEVIDRALAFKPDPGPEE